MPLSQKVMKRLHKNPKIAQRSCTKHGVYAGPYCPECYKKAIGSDEPSPGPVKPESD
jgi:hypothetical protein